MKEIIWIIGSSAAGKETFINFVLQNSDSPVLNSLGLGSKKIAKSEVSTKYIGQYENDPITLKRDKIFNEVPKLLKTFNTVLVKWQTVDSEALRINKLLTLVPNAQHRIIQICTSQDELSKRLPLKSWWDDDDIDNMGKFIEEEILHVQHWIDKLENKLPVTKITGNSKAKYTIIKS